MSDIFGQMAGLEIFGRTVDVSIGHWTDIGHMFSEIDITRPHPSCGPDVTSPVPVARSSPTPAAAKAAPVPATVQPATSGDELSRCRAVAVFPALSMALHKSQRTGCRTGGIFQPQLSTKR